MKLFTAIILLLLNFTSVLHVVSGRRRCRVCPELQQINAKLAQLQQIDAKIDQINTTLDKLLAGGGTSGSGSSVLHAVSKRRRCRVCPELQQINAKLAQLRQIDAKLDQINATLDKLLAGRGTSGSGSSSATCKEIYDKLNAQEDKAYELTMQDVGKISVYCHMSDAGLGECGGGGWTLVMKIDGSKSTFLYDSSYWSDKNEYGLPEGATALDTDEVKVPTYWDTPFTKICLGMEVNGQRNYLVIEKIASSLHSLIADGEHRDTFLGRDKWKSLTGAEASLQTNCNQEGFSSIGGDPNASKARIGIIGNQENDCNSCDSRIGFGTGGSHDNSNACGNEATFSPDNGDKHIKAMGYILVQ